MLLQFLTFIHSNYICLVRNINTKYACIVLYPATNEYKVQRVLSMKKHQNINNSLECYRKYL